MRRPDDSAFSMIEVAIAIAVIAILAGSVAPLALKALNQQREQKTRENMKIAWETMFGARDRSIPNMTADFGFATPSLLQMTRRPAGLRAYQPYAGTHRDLSGGWNGPYWTGSTDSTGVPVDGWGRAFELRTLGTTRQLLSWGANGTRNTQPTTPTPQGDDLAFPVPPAAASLGTVTVNVSRIGGFPVSAATVTYYISGAQANPDTGTIPLSGGAGTAALHPGRVKLVATIPNQAQYPPAPATAILPAAPGQTLTQIIDLLPGGASVVNFTCP